MVGRWLCGVGEAVVGRKRASTFRSRGLRVVMEERARAGVGCWRGAGVSGGGRAKGEGGCGREG